MGCRLVGPGTPSLYAAMTPKVTTMGGEVAWRYKTQEELELTSPQRHHGVSSEREEAKRLAYSSLLRDAGETLKMCDHVQCCAAWVVVAEIESCFLVMSMKYCSDVHLSLVLHMQSHACGRSGHNAVPSLLRHPIHALI